ncbi:ferritin-like protein [Hymenobacter lucidus]|uniref:Ferritin-like protein n=1 Tax=Hymenobacter lucidus TaxID=2880930 RepID=A0ABS8AL37_9BACT|nr:ferritin-like protein [Hymenobacter lucidus]MCB2406353.1 ferritin-like protein [Hymenobacter lucidus]
MQGNIARYLEPIFSIAEKTHREAVQLRAARALAPGAEALLAAPTTTEAAAPAKPVIPRELTGKGYLGFLLHINAEIEHGLMVQYLYAAYSIGGEQVPEQYRDRVRRWQEVILGIAKEEMGHFISCQNVLRLIGAPLNFARDDYPWDTPFYPFPFTLQPLTLDSLAKYVFAESPEGWIDSDDPIAREIKEKMQQVTADPHRVGTLFTVILQLIQDPDLISDEVFQSKTYPYQAKFDEWGRGYTGGNRGNTTGGNPPGTPDVLVMPLLSRDDAYNALLAISEQGEAPHVAADESGPSHFARFLTIYKEMREVLANTGGSWLPSRNLATNPYVGSGQPDEASTNLTKSGQPTDYTCEPITNEEAKAWAELFNLRYRMLLNYLMHSFQLDDSADIYGTRTPRGTIIAATFGEMYNLRSIANVLVRLPLADTGDKLAGPPFMIPYTLDLPMGELNKWLQHKDLLEASATVAHDIMALSATNQTYLNSLLEADKQLLQLVTQLTTKSPL